MAFLKLLFGSSRAKNSAAYTKLSTSRKFAMEFNRDEAILFEFENKILRR